MKTPKILPLNHPGLIHQLFLLLPQNHLIQKPDYFGVGLVGAHISIIYPEEQMVIEESDLNQAHHFDIKGVYQATFEAKTYYVLMVLFARQSVLASLRAEGVAVQL